MNDDSNFKNGGNVRNVENVRTDIKCLTFSETYFNDDGNFRDG